MNIEVFDMKIKIRSITSDTPLKTDRALVKRKKKSLGKKLIVPLKLLKQKVISSVVTTNSQYTVPSWVKKPIAK